MPKIVTAVFLTLVIGTFGLPDANAAQLKAGTKCSTVNRVVAQSGKSFKCTFVNKKLVWVVKPAPKASPTSAKTLPSGKPSATPTSTATPKAGSTSNQSSNPNTASPKATPTPTPTAKAEPAKPQTITSTIPDSIPILGKDFGVGFMTSSGLPLTITSKTPTQCSAENSVITLLSTGTCTLTATQAGNSAFLPATLDKTFTIVAPVFSPADDQISAAMAFTVVPKGQTYKAELFEFTVLKVEDNVDQLLCADSPENQGCILDSYGVSVLDPKEPNRVARVHVKVHDTDTELLGPTFFFRLISGTKILEVNLNTTLPTLNDATVLPGESAEGDYYISIPKGFSLDHAYLLLDDNFVSVDQVVIFAI